MSRTLPLCLHGSWVPDRVSHHYDRLENYLRGPLYHVGCGSRRSTCLILGRIPIEVRVRVEQARNTQAKERAAEHRSVRTLLCSTYWPPSEAQLKNWLLAWPSASYTDFPAHIFDPTQISADIVQASVRFAVGRRTSEATKGRHKALGTLQASVGDHLICSCVILRACQDKETSLPCTIRQGKA